MGFMFSVFPLMFGLVFCGIMGVFVYVFVTAIRRNHQNNHSPRLTVPATVVAKRDHRSHNREHV